MLKMYVLDITKNLSLVINKNIFTKIKEAQVRWSVINKLTVPALLRCLQHLNRHLIFLVRFASLDTLLAPPGIEISRQVT